MSKADASDKAQSFDTRVAHQVLMDGLNNIQESLKDASIERKVEVGSVLWEFWDRTKKVLDTIKKDVRTEAVDLLNGASGTTTVDGDDSGSAMVVVPSASLRIPKGKNIEDIKKALGPKFSLFFEEVTTFKPQKEFESRVEALDDSLEQTILLEAVERHEMTPRVTFRRDRTPQPAKVPVSDLVNEGALDDLLANS